MDYQPCSLLNIHRPFAMWRLIGDERMLIVALVTQDDRPPKSVADQSKKAKQLVEVACEVALPLRYGAAEPVLETHRADARVIAGGEALIIQLCAEVACVNVCGHLPCILLCVQE